MIIGESFSSCVKLILLLRKYDDNIIVHYFCLSLIIGILDFLSTYRSEHNHTM